VGEVERRQNRPDAEWAQDRAIALSRIECVEAPREPVVLFHLRRVGINDVCRFLDLADGLDAVLAGLEDEQRRQAELLLADQRRGAAHNGDPLLPRSLRPRRKGCFGGCHGIVDVGYAAGREAANEDPVVGWRADLEGVDASALFAANEQGIRLAEVAAQLLEGGIERAVHRLDLLGGRGVGDLVGNSHGYSSCIARVSWDGPWRCGPQPGNSTATRTARESRLAR
jgi:hypothetical protein